MLRDARPSALKNAGICLSRSAGPPPAVPRDSVVGVRKSAGQEIVVGLLGVDGAGRRIAELGQARQRLADPSAVAVRQDLDAAPHVVQLVEQDVMARRAEPAERLALGRLEEHVERAAPFRNASNSAASSAPAGYVLPPIVQAVRRWSSSHSRCRRIRASSGFSIFTSFPSRRRKHSEVKKSACGPRSRARSRA